jgi:glycosyltransferase involved in cell wall biosynthesis
VRIGIYNPYLDTLAGGERYILTVASCLAKKHSVSLFWPRNKESELKEEIQKKFNLDLSHIPFVENIFSPQTSFITRLQKSRQYDYIILLSDGSIPFVACKLILHFQTPMPWITSSWKNRAKLLSVKQVICNSLYTKRYIDEELRLKSKVIYPPIAIEEKNEKKENIILNVGRFGVSNAGSSAKKQEFMGEVFKKMVDKGLKNWKFVFVMSYKEEAKKAVDDFKKSIHTYPIEIVENPSNDMLWQIYNKSKIYWHAAGYGEDLEKYPGRAEHFGMATVEAMGTGAVPIVINAGGQSEIVQDKKSGMLWNTEEELIEKTKEVMDSSIFWESLSKTAKERAKSFSKDRFCQEWEKEIV